jgi:hypothetical protein
MSMAVLSHIHFAERLSVDSDITLVWRKRDELWSCVSWLRLSAILLGRALSVDAAGLFLHRLLR